jgi:hypothetical protein
MNGPSGRGFRAPGVPNGEIAGHDVRRTLSFRSACAASARDARPAGFRFPLALLLLTLAAPVAAPRSRRAPEFVNGAARVTLDGAAGAHSPWNAPRARPSRSACSASATRCAERPPDPDALLGATYWYRFDVFTADANATFGAHAAPSPPPTRPRAARRPTCSATGAPCG